MNNSEIKQQLYGGEISDYLPGGTKKNSDNNKEDLRKISDIYSNLIKNNLPLTKFNTCDNLNNKLK